MLSFSANVLQQVKLLHKLPRLLHYSKFSKISYTLLFLFSNKMLVIRADIHKKVNRIANREDPDQTASEEAVWSGSALFCLSHFGKQLAFKILEHLP